MPSRRRRTARGRCCRDRRAARSARHSSLVRRAPRTRSAWTWAARAVAKLGERAGLGLEETAAGIVRVAGAEMARAVRVVTVERGTDPRELALVPFGGAGPLHAAAIADELGMTRIVVPQASGVLSALGLLVSERRRDLAESVLLTGEALTREGAAVVRGVPADREGPAIAGLPGATLVVPPGWHARHVGAGTLAMERTG